MCLFIFKVILAVTHFLFISKGLTNIELKNVKFTCCKPPVSRVYYLLFFYLSFDCNILSQISLLIVSMILDSKIIGRYF